jgi:hypothetical protein
MKSITAVMQAKLDAALGTEPQIIIKINWAAGDEYYSDGVIDFDAIICTPAILSFTPLETYSKLTGISKLMSASLVLNDDEAGSLMMRMDH